MAGLLIYPRGDRLLAELDAERTLEAGTVALGAHADEGKLRVVVALGLADGRFIVGQTDLALLLTATEAFVAVHGDPRVPCTSR